MCCDNSHEEPDLGEGGATVDRAHGRSVQIRIGRRKQRASLFLVLEKKQQVCMHQGVRRGVCEAEGVPGQSTGVL